ncbi:hypothetical protein HAZT_HAZT005708 [Hyalella azteca]|uniref:HEAT repeat-containing protein 1 n=1 Tax=Hyalella azteca TaxID=294128 RepID=A0A6A0HDK5_HYAAZ|nr:hypothetical protein HAZT_HAZT005708 [Hyalella azteca]
MLEVYCKYAYRTKKAGLVSVQRNTSTDSNTSCNNSTISQYGGSTNSIGDSIRALSTASVTPMSTHEASREGATSPYGRAPEQGAGVRKNLHAGGSGMGAEEAVEKLARMTLQLSLDLQNGIDYYEHSFEKSLRIPYVNTLYRIWEKQLTENTLRILSEYQRGENLEVSEAAVWNQCAILTEMELSREPEPLPTSCSPAPFILYLALAEFSRFSLSHNKNHRNTSNIARHTTSHDTSHNTSHNTSLITSLITSHNVSLYMSHNTSLITSRSTSHYMSPKSLREHLTGSGECSRTTTGLTLGCVWRQFSPSVSCWLDHTCYTVLVRIRRAILTDRVANTGEPVQYTTSAVDVTSCFYHVKTFWRHLAWPDPSSAYNLILKIIQASISGFNDLVKLNGKFGKYKHLFSEESKHVQRFVADSDTNKVLDEAIEGFLLLLSPYFLTLTPALKAMEWLLQRYAIHEMNVDAVMMCILPYYESPLFLRTVKVLNLKQVGSSGEQNRWNWLLRAQQSGMLLVKSIMYDQWVHNPAFRLFCNKYIKKVIKVHDRDCDAQHAINFFTTTVVGGVARMADLGKNTGKSLATEEHVMRVLQGMHVWVKCSFNELVCGSYLITMQLSMSVQLNTNLWDQIIALLLKYQKEELQAQLCVCLVTVYNHQYMTRMGPAVLELLQESSVLQKLADKPDNTRVTSFLLAYAGGYVKSCLEEYSGAEKELQQHLLSLAIYLSQFRLSAAQAAAVIRNIMEAASEYGQSMPEKELKSCLSSLLEHFEKSWPEGYDKALSFFQAQAASASATEHSKVLTMMNSVSQKQLTESLSVDEVSAVEVASAVSSVQSILVSLKKLNSACVRNVDAQLTRDLADSLTDQCIQAVRTYKVERHPVKTAPKHEKVWLQLAETGVVAWDLLSAVAEACLLVVSALTPSTNYCFPTHTKQCQGDSFTLLLSLKLVYLLHFKRRKAQRVGDDSCVLRLLSSIWGLQPHMPHCDLATPDVKVLCMESALSLLQDESGKEATKTLSLLAMQQREFIVPSIISALSFCDDDSDVQRSVRCAAAQLVSTIHTNVTSSSSAKGYAPLISALHKHTKAVFMDTSSQYLVSTMSSVCREDPALLQLVLSAVTSSSQPPHLAGVLLFTLAQLEHKSIIGKLLPIIERLVRKGSAEGGQTSSDAAVDSQFTLDPSESMLLYWSLVHLNSESVKVLDTDKGWQVISAAFNVNKTIINLEGQLLSPQAVIAQQVISHKLLRHLNSSKALGKLWSLMAAAASDIGTSQRKVSRLHQALKSVSLHAKFVLEQIQQLNLITATTSIKDAQAKRMKIDQEKSLRKARRSVGDSKETPKSDDGEDVAPTSLPGNWRHLYLLLELLCEVEGVSEPWLLVDMLCTCLNEGLAFGLQLAEPVVQQLLASLHHLIQLTLTHPPKNTCVFEINLSYQSLSSVVPVNVEAVVQCIRQSSDPYTHRQAFLVLAVAANIHPDAVLHNLMTIFTFMGEGLLQRDDHFSYQVIETTVNTLVPILVQRSRNSCAVGDVVQVFVDALPDISVHRRLMIFKLLTVALQPHTHLWLVLSLTIKSYALSGHSRLAEDTSTRSSSRSDLNSSYASSGGASDAMLGRKRAGELNFILRLCEEFAVRDQVIAVQQILALLTALPTDIGTSYKKNWSMNHQFISVLKLNALSGKQLRNFIYTTVGFLNQLFTSETFLATLLPVSESSEEKEQEKLQQSYCQLLTTVTAYLDTTTNLISHTQRTDTLSYKFWSALQRKIVEFHESVCAVLQSRQLLSVASLLVRSPLPAVKLRSLELLRTRLLPSAAFFTENDTEALLLLLPELLSLGCCDTESQDTKQVSLSVLHLLLRFLGTSLKPEEVLPVLHTAVLQIPKQGEY